MLHISHLDTTALKDNGKDSPAAGIDCENGRIIFSQILLYEIIVWVHTRHAKRKKQRMDFLKIDSPFMIRFQRVCDYFSLGLLWMLASLPIITFGAATTAMMQTAEFSIRKESGKIFAPFWQYFRKEFKQATLLWLIQLPLLAILAFNFYLVIDKQMTPIFRLLIGVASIIELCWIQLWFPYQSKFTDTTKTILANTIRLTLGNIGLTFLMATLSVASLVSAFFLFFLLLPAILLIPGIYIALYSSLFRRLVKKNLPLMKPEENDSKQSS